jgi:hypothetical protein
MYSRFPKFFVEQRFSSPNLNKGGQNGRPPRSVNDSMCFCRAGGLTCRFSKSRLSQPAYNFCDFKWSFFYLILFLQTALFAASNVQVQATLEPSTLAAGETAELRITINGLSVVNRPNIPDVNGLEITFVGQSSQFQFVNGYMSGGVTFTYAVIPQKEGEFTIPAISIGVAGTSEKTNPLLLHAQKSNFVPPPIVQQQQQQPSTSAPTSKSAPPNSNAAGNTNANSNAPAAPKEAAWIELNYPKREFYVGELIPVDLKIYVRQGLNLLDNSAPSFSGTAFTFNKLSKAEQVQTIINGQPYFVTTVHTAVSAVKSGDHPLGAQMELTVLVTMPSRRRSPFGGRGAFNDPWFDSFFGDVEQKRVTISTPSDTVVKVLPLPSEGKPSDFSGAIGHFQMSVSASPTEVNAGDPITLKMNINGTGNFDRVRAPEIPKNDHYKTYPPNSKFEASDEIGYSGQKTFEQVFIPKGSEVKQIPDILFNYFDPESHKYVTLTSNVLAVKVTGSSAAATETVQNTTTMPNSLPTLDAPKIGSTELVPNKLEMGAARASLTPILFSFGFWSIPSVSLLALGFAWGIASRRQRMKDDPNFARSISASKAIRVHLNALEEAVKEGDAKTFFISGRKALRERLGECLGVKAETITLSEVEESLELSPVLSTNLRKFFEMADAIEYSGQSYTPEALVEWKNVLLALLQELERKKK